MKSVSTLREESWEREAAPQTFGLLLADVARAGALLPLHGVLLPDALGGAISHSVKPRWSPGPQHS